MTIGSIQQHLTLDPTDKLENVHNAKKNRDEVSSDSIRRLNTQLLAGMPINISDQQIYSLFSYGDQTSRALFGDTTDLLDDILSHPLSIDYFNVYLSLPIFAQRVFCHRTTHQFDFDPPLLPKHQTGDRINDEAKPWLIHCRLDHYIHTDIYIESLLSLLLIQPDDSSSELHASIDSKKAATEEQSEILSTVTDVRQFHQFLQPTSGMNYWNFFIDSMRVLRSRYSSQFNRLDVSHLNFIYKYYSQQQEFHSITIDDHKFRMPDSTTSDTIWFQMAINAMHQLRTYWLPRYLGQLSATSRSVRKHSTVLPISNQMENHSKQSTENTIAVLSNQSSHTSTGINETKLIKYTLDNVSYLDYNPRQYLLIQASERDDLPQNIEELTEHQIETDGTMTVDYPSSDRSLEDYATDANIELFYRIFVSDSFAGYPFCQYLSQTLLKTDAISLQTCIRFITDAEVLWSMPFGNFKERLVRQFISRYLTVTATYQLPDHIFDNIDEQRLDLINELLRNNTDQDSLLWKILLKIPKLLTPHFLNYLKFDRLRCLVQGHSFHTSLIIDDLRQLLPSVNFETLLTDQHIHFNESELSSAINAKPCHEQSDDLVRSLLTNRYSTTEKRVNTDEQCEFRPGERFSPLTNDELEHELRQFCTKLQWKDVKTLLGKSFDASLTSSQTGSTTFNDDQISPNERQQTFVLDESLPVNSIETFTSEIMSSAREIFEIDRYVLHLMDESLNLVQTNDSIEATTSTPDSSSSLFKEVVRTDSSLTKLFPQRISHDINNTAPLSSVTEINSTDKRAPIERKFLSLIGSYFINLPSHTSQSDVLPVLESTRLNDSLDPIVSTYLHDDRLTSINEFTPGKQFDSPSNKEELPSIPKPLTTNIKRAYDKDHFFHESIHFAPKDKSNEVKTIVPEQHISYGQNDDQQHLLTFIENHISNHQWPLHEYIGIKGQRAWRALKLAADISNFEKDLMFDYHHDLDWISTENDFGSFGERTCLIQRNFQRRIEQQQRSISKDNC